MSSKQAKRARKMQREMGIRTKHERRRAAYDRRVAEEEAKQAAYNALPEEEKEQIQAERKRQLIIAGENVRQLAAMAGMIAGTFR
jgi:hypothetical protein